MNIDLLANIFAERQSSCTPECSLTNRIEPVGRSIDFTMRVGNETAGPHVVSAVHGAIAENVEGACIKPRGKEGCRCWPVRYATKGLPQFNERVISSAIIDIMRNNSLKKWSSSHHLCKLHFLSSFIFHRASFMSDPPCFRYDTYIPRQPPTDKSLWWWVLY